jgi:hypothetical protein
MSRQTVKLVREGAYAAEVDVRLMDDEAGWPPYLSLQDAQKLDAMRRALRSDDLDSATRLGRVFRLLPVSA